MIQFNTTLLAGEAVRFKGYNKTNQGSTMQVLVGMPFPRAFAEANTHNAAKEFDYPPWQVSRSGCAPLSLLAARPAVLPAPALAARARPPLPARVRREQQREKQGR